MKKYIVLILCSIMILTGCQNKSDKSPKTTSLRAEPSTSVITDSSSESEVYTSTTSKTKEESSTSTTTTTKSNKTTTTTKTTTKNNKTTSTTKTTTKTSATTKTSTSSTKATTTTTTTTQTTTTQTTVKVLSEQEVYQSMISLKSQYPEGMSWTNDNYYGWKGGIYSGGYGCAGFAFLLSDAAFGTRRAKMHYDYNNIKVGDILRLNNDTHSVIVLEVHDNHYIIAEGNYNSHIHWGRKITKDEVASAKYVLTRY